MFLHDLKLLDFEEPFSNFFAHGLLIKDGAKMSKSRGNVVNPDEYIAKFGADALRLYLMFLGPMDSSPDFRDTGIEGMQKFVQRLWILFNGSKKLEAENKNEVYVKLHQTIKKVTDDMSNFKYNTSIASIMELVNVISEKGADEEVLKSLCLLLAPFAPHLTEEVWVEILGQPFSVHKAAWPKNDTSKIMSDIVTIIVQVNGKVRGTLDLEPGISNSESKVTERAKKDEKVAKWLEGKTIKKTIFVSGKLINFVIS
jgi:leucyl-tRNA synthetase